MILLMDMRSPLRRSLEEKDYPGIIAALQEDTLVVGECWVWQRACKAGYGIIRVATGSKRITAGGKKTAVNKEYSVHRLMAMAASGGTLDNALVVHHTCANRKCCNPAHLQEITQHANTAEMLERASYVKKINDLEARVAGLVAENLELKRRLAEQDERVA